MKVKDQRFQEYYITGKYKGFKKIEVKNYKMFFLSTHLTFSNGQAEIFASGRFEKDALKKIFDKIDVLHNNKNPHTN